MEKIVANFTPSEGETFEEFNLTPARRSNSLFWALYSMENFQHHQNTVLDLLGELEAKYFSHLGKEKNVLTCRRTGGGGGYRGKYKGSEWRDLFNKHNEQIFYNEFGQVDRIKPGYAWTFGLTTPEVIMDKYGRYYPLETYRHPMTALASFDRGDRGMGGGPRVDGTTDIFAFQLPLSRLPNGLPRSEINWHRRFVEKVMTQLRGCYYVMAIMPSKLEYDWFGEPTLSAIGAIGGMAEIGSATYLDTRVRGYGHWLTGLGKGHLEALGGEEKFLQAAKPLKVNKKDLGGQPVWELEAGDSPIAIPTENRKRLKDLFKPIQSVTNLEEGLSDYWRYSKSSPHGLAKILANNSFYDLLLDIPEWVDPGTFPYPKNTLPEGFNIIEDEAD